MSRCQNPAYAAHINYHVVFITYLKSASGYSMYMLYIHITVRRQWLKEKQLVVTSIDTVFNWFHSKVLIRNERQMLYTKCVQKQTELLL